MINIRNIVQKITNMFYNKPKNHIIMISIDNLRFDCIGYQQNKKGLAKYQLENVLKTPTLDEIADKSICFNNVISTSTYTTASHASIITGLYPPRNGVRAFYDTKLSDNIFTLAELLKGQGYVTVLSTDVLELWEPLDLHRGFTYIFERQDKELYEFLNLHKSENIFVLIHYFDVHEPYIFSEYEIFENYNSDYYDMLDILYRKHDVDLGQDLDQIRKSPHTAWKKLVDNLRRNKKILFPLYVKGVNKFDSGRFKKFITYLKNSDYLDNSLLVIFSDHGEGRCIEDENFFNHSGALYEDVIKVPLMIYNKNLKHKIINTQISTVDIFPTIIDLSLCKDISIPYRIDGQSLMSEINGIDDKDHLAYSEVWTTDSGIYYLGDGCKGVPKILSSNKVMNWILNQRTIRIKGKKYMIYGRPEVFIDDSIFNLSNEEFSEKLYNYLLGRNSEVQGIEYWSKILNQKILSKKDVLTSFLQSEEYQKRRFTIFNLENDPDELSHIDPTKDPICLIEFFDIFNRILDIEKMVVHSKKININEDEQKVKKRLKDLGYFG